MLLGAELSLFDCAEQFRRAAARGIIFRSLAQVAELVDALVSGISSRKGVKVRVLSWAPLFSWLQPLAGPQHGGTPA